MLVLIEPLLCPIGAFLFVVSPFIAEVLFEAKGEEEGGEGVLLQIRKGAVDKTGRNISIYQR